MRAATRPSRCRSRSDAQVTIEQFKNVLVLAPHTDDGEFGCGGTMARLIENGVKVTYAAFSTAAKSVPPEFPRDILRHEVRAATSVLGIPEDDLLVFDFEVRTFPTVRQDILDQMIVLQRDLAPDCVLMPALVDLHQDHKTVAEEGLRAFKRTTVLAYEIPWNNLTFHQQAYVRLDERHIDKKVAALACYKSQDHRNYIREDYIRNVALTRGINVGYEFAEVFEVYRWIL
jgi:N-acetylglucosamine malate deacetylase 1